MVDGMSPVSVPHATTQSNALQVGLRAVEIALAATNLDVLAAAIGKDDSTACRVRSGETKVCISDAIRLMYAAGYKAVPQGKVCVDRGRYEAMVTMASAAMADEQTMRRLTWDES